ncbi:MULTISPECIES: lysophospholipid acyltransferase family protein [unclassified Desulfovibrio]|uniref:lysophospholipid acyltransferase family protein n=1 Tax=unclassified Desulfovibrio TaxID=2593640 RepID=UPI002FDA2201
MHPYIEGEFAKKFLTGDSYTSQGTHTGFFTRLMPSLSFYTRLFGGPLRWLCARAAKGKCDDSAWVHASVWVSELMERIGCPIEVQGMNAIEKVDGPCLFVANHMSTLETFMLPGMIRPRMPVTFVVKKSLTTMPLFGPVMRSRAPIVLGRSNPREDLTAVLEGGLERLSKGISIIVFPQSTRALAFDQRHFNTIGVKLARKAGVPLIPLALKTDAWGQGKKIKELGPVKPGMPVRYCFASPVRIQGQGKEEHAAICRHIAEHLDSWQRMDGVNGQTA